MPCGRGRSLTAGTGAADGFGGEVEQRSKEATAKKLRKKITIMAETQAGREGGRGGGIRTTLGQETRRALISQSVFGLSGLLFSASLTYLPVCMDGLEGHSSLSMKITKLRNFSSSCVRRAQICPRKRHVLVGLRRQLYSLLNECSSQGGWTKVLKKKKSPECNARTVRKKPHGSLLI